MKTPETKDIIAIGYLVFFILVAFLIYKVLRATGLIKSLKEKQEQMQVDQFFTTSATEAFKPNYYNDIIKQSRKSVKVYTQKSADNLAKKIINAFGIFNDNEELIYGILSDEIKTKTQLSFVAKAAQKQNKSLLSLFESKLNDSEKKKVLAIINSKPIGILDSKGNVVK